MINEKQKEGIEFSPIFNKKLAKAPTEIKLAVRQALELFRESPHHEALRNHLLTERYAGFRSIDVTEDWRVLYREEKERIMFADLGTHEELYG
jgi:addiction module RelE/StbE family toxin